MRAPLLLTAPVATAIAVAACTHGTLTLDGASGVGIQSLSAHAHLGSATLLWSPVAGASRYTVYLAETSAFTPASASRSVPDAVSPLEVTGLDAGPWYAVVTCTGSAGESAPSPVIRIDPLPVGNGGVTPLAVPAWSKDFSPAARFGGTLLAAGDTNKDGYGDVLIGAYRWTNGQSQEGGLFLYRGTATGLESTYAWHDECNQAGAACGTGAAAADFDGDGNIDLVNGGSDYMGTLASEGAGALFFGTPTGPSNTVSKSWFGGQAGANLGRHLGQVGDVNGDGKPDLLVPAQGYDDTLSNEGKVWLYLGTASGLTLNSTWSASGGSTGAGFGWNLSSTPGDVNDDGYDDLVVGGFRTTEPETEEGRVSFFAGSATGPQLVPSWTWEPHEAGAHFGNSVALADVNGDGFADLVAGAPGHATGAGRAYVFFGSANGLAANPSWQYDGGAGDAVGEAVASAGDVNGDGYDDVLVGAPGFDGAASDVGRALLFLGGPAGLAAQPSWTREGDTTGERLGGTLAGAKDVNGDGSPDLLLGIESQTEITAPVGRAELFFGPPADAPAVDAGAPFDATAGAVTPLSASYVAYGPISAAHSCAVDWGDGSAPEITAPCSPTALSSLSHSWTVAGDYLVRVRVRNDFGLAGESFTTVHVH